MTNSVAWRSIFHTGATQWERVAKISLTKCVKVWFNPIYSNIILEKVIMNKKWFSQTKISNISSIVNVTIRTISYFLKKRILQHKKRKTSNFYSLKSLCAQKKFAFCCFLFAYFCFVGWFLVVLCFLCCRIFLKRHKKSSW